MEPKRLDEMTMEELASLDFEADKAQKADGGALEGVKAKLAARVRTGVRAGINGWPPSAAN